MLDITPQKDAERALRDANDELEFGVLARTSELDEANEMMALEIGERRRVEAELREAETRYRLLVEDLPAVVYTWDPNLMDHPDDPEDHPYLGPQIESILGFSPAEWKEIGVLEDPAPPPRSRSRRGGGPITAQRPASRSTWSTGTSPRTASVVWVLDRATLRTRDERGSPRIFQGLMLDITKRKEAEQKATEVESRFRILTEQGPVMSYFCTLDQDLDPPGITAEFVSPRSPRSSDTRWSIGWASPIAGST